MFTYHVIKITRTVSTIKGDSLPLIIQESLRYDSRIRGTSLFFSLFFSSFFQVILILFFFLLILVRILCVRVCNECSHVSVYVCTCVYAYACPYFRSVYAFISISFPFFSSCFPPSLYLFIPPDSLFRIGYTLACILRKVEVLSVSLINRRIPEEICRQACDSVSPVLER